MVLVFALAALLVPKGWIVSTQDMIASKAQKRVTSQATQAFSAQVEQLDQALQTGDRTQLEAILRAKDTILLRRFVSKFPINATELESLQKLLPELGLQLQGQSPEQIKAYRVAHAKHLRGVLPRAEKAEIVVLLHTFDRHLQEIQP